MTVRCTARAVCGEFTARAVVRCGILDYKEDCSPSQSQSRVGTRDGRNSPDGVVSVETQVHLCYHNGQNHDKEYWVSKQEEVCCFCMLW